MIWTALYSLHSTFNTILSLDAPYERNYELHCMGKKTNPEKLNNSPEVTRDSNPGLSGPSPKCFLFSLATSPSISQRQGPSSVTLFLKVPPPKGMCENGEDATRMHLGFLDTYYLPHSLHHFSPIFMVDSMSWDYSLTLQMQKPRLRDMPAYAGRVEIQAHS